MSEVLVVHHSRGGNTEKLAEAIAEGVREGGGDSTLKSEVDVKELPEYDGIIAGSSAYYGTTYGTMSADLKKLFDDSAGVRKK